MHKELESWVTLPCHIYLGGALKMIRMKYMKHMMIEYLIVCVMDKECKYVTQMVYVML